WEAAQVEHMHHLLEEAARRRPGDEDLRGFEWHYLWRLGHPEVQTLQGHTGWVVAVAFSPDGRRLATAGGDPPGRIWEAAGGKQLLALKGHADPVWGVAFSPDGRRVASASLDWTVRVWGATGGEELLTLQGHTGPVWGVAFSPDGLRLASACGTARKPAEVKL